MKLFKFPQLGEKLLSFAGRWACGSFDKTLGLWPMLIVATLVGPADANQLVRAEISRIGDTSHLEFKGLGKWNYELKSEGKGVFKLQIPALDPASVAALSTWSDAFISKTDVSKAGQDGAYIVTFYISDPKVESFDYLTDEPSRLIIDFYKQADGDKPKTAEVITTPTATTNAATKEVATQLPKKVAKGKTAAATTADGYKKKTGNRSPAGDERLAVNDKPAVEDERPSTLGGVAFDASDPTFKRLMVKDYAINEEAMIASRRNLYLLFPALSMPVSILPELQSNLPEYIINGTSSEENKQARLLLMLYNRQVNKTDRTKDRVGAFIKVFEHYTKTYPQSEYDEIIKNLAAHMYYQRWLAEKDNFDFEKSMAFYKYLITKYPSSPLAERNQQILAFAQLEHGDGLAALQEFSDYLVRYPKTTIKDQINLAQASAYLELNKYPEASKIYREIANSAQDPQRRVEAEFRLGDVSFKAKDWATAESTFAQAIKKFPSHVSTYPNAYFNMAEAQFWQRKYLPSLESHIQFLSLFPNHEQGGYSMTRAGELMDAMGIDRSRVMGAYLESYFRYKKNPGAEVARIRLLSQQMKGMKEKELKKAIEEIDQIAANSPLPQIGEFAVIMRVDGLQRRGENQAALKDLIEFYQSHPTSTNLDLFRTRILRNVAETMDRQIADGQFMESLKTKSKYDRTWLKNSDRIDIRYFQGRSFEMAGVYGEAKKFYDEVLDARKKIAGQSEEKIRGVNEILPAIDTIRLRLAAVAVNERDYPEAYRQLQTLADPKNLTSPEKMERAELYAKVYEERGQLDQAQTYLKSFIDGWKGDPSEISSSENHLAELYLKSKQPAEAEKVVDQVIAKRQQKTDVADETYARALQIKGQALENQNKDLAAIESYQQLLDEMEDQKPLGDVRYRLGELLFKKGDLGGAEKVWMKLDSRRYATYRKMATEQLENARWQSEHRRYLSRIPAMAPVKEK